MFFNGRRLLQGKLPLRFPGLSHSNDSSAFSFNSDALPGTFKSLSLRSAQVGKVMKYKMVKRTKR
jgi:hypothetical protein